MKRVLFTYNTTKYLVRFRRRLVERLQGSGVEVHALTPEDEYVPDLAAMGVRWHPWRLSRHGTRPISEAKSVAAAFRTIRAVRPDAIVNVTLKAVLYAGAAAALASVPRRVALVAGLGNAMHAPGWLGRMIRASYKQALRWHHGVMVQNSDDENAVRRLLGTGARTAVLKLPGSGVDLDVFSPSAARADGRPLVMMVTRLVWAKGLREFCAAASRLRERANFVLVGALDSNPDSPSASEVGVLAAAAGVELKIDVRDVASELRRAHVFVYPSYYPEGIPRSVIEALATGLPVITTTAPGCRESVEDGNEGYLVPPRDVSGIEARLHELLDSEDLAARLGRAARRRAEANYDERLVAQMMAEFIGGPSAAPSA